MAEHPNEAQVRRGYAAFSTGDMATLAEILSPDVVHKVAGNNLVSGEYKGRDEVFAYYGRLMELTGGTLHVELLSATAQGDDKVVARHRGTATRGGKTIDTTDTIVFTIVDGIAVELDQTSDDQAAEDAFWA